MNSLNDSLRRLLQAAASAPKPVPSTAPAPLLESVLRQRRGGPVEDEAAFLLAMFRGAAIFAGFIMVLSVTTNYFVEKQEADGPLPLAKYALTMQLPP